MLNPQTLTLNSVVSFDLYPSQLLGTGYKNVKLLAILDADTARSWIDPVAMHANVYPTLPPSTPNKFNGYPYLKLKLPDGSITAIGLPWIRDETFQVATTRSMRLLIEAVSPEDQNKVLLALSSNGFNAVDVSYEN